MGAVSIPVDLAALHEQISRFGAGAFLVSTSSDGPPHVASVVVDPASDGLVMGAGRSTRVNIAHHPAVSLVWPADDDGDYCLIVDGVARTAPADSETVVVHPASAVLHRLAEGQARI